MSRLVAEVMSCVYIDYQAMVKVSPSCTKIKSKFKRKKLALTQYATFPIHPPLKFI